MNEPAEKPLPQKHQTGNQVHPDLLITTMRVNIWVTVGLKTYGS